MIRGGKLVLHAKTKLFVSELELKDASSFVSK